VLHFVQDPYCVVVQGCSVVPYSRVGDSDGELLPPPLLAFVVLKMLTLYYEGLLP
jgi:hypothetical protein